MKAFYEHTAQPGHCAGMKSVEFISLLNVSTQYLKVKDLLWCSGDFHNSLFPSSLYCHNSEINLQVCFFGDCCFFCSLTATTPAIPAAILSPAMPPVLTVMRNGMTVESALNQS